MRVGNCVLELLVLFCVVQNVSFFFFVFFCFFVCCWTGCQITESITQFTIPRGMSNSTTHPPPMVCIIQYPDDTSYFSNSDLLAIADAQCALQRLLVDRIRQNGFAVNRSSQSNSFLSKHDHRSDHK